VAAAYDPAYQVRLKLASRQYLVGDGDSMPLCELCREKMKIYLTLGGGPEPHAARRAGPDRAQEFERRLDAYETTETHRPNVIDEVEKCLLDLGYPGRAPPGASERLDPNGRLPGTTADMLIKAIAKLKDPGMRSDCAARFEMLATQIWAWRYPVLTAAWRDRILLDFRENQASLVSEMSDPQAGCPNVVIRMLWHFDRTGFPFSVGSFRVPTGDDAWRKNIARLRATGKWDPRVAAAPPAASGGHAAPGAKPNGPEASSHSTMAPRAEPGRTRAHAGAPARAPC
jgi:hypothetical protein